MDENSGINGERIIKICELNQAHLSSMEEKILSTPMLLSNYAGQSTCCIFKVPQSQVRIEQQAYYPHIVSIGPYHHGEEPLKMIQEHKWRFLRNLLARTQSKGLQLPDLLKAIKSMEKKARECYSQAVSFDSDEFVEMMVLDGCFIIELFRIAGKVIRPDRDDPIFALSWMFLFLLRDFIKLENQIPFFVLQALFDLSKMPEEDEETGLSLIFLAMNSFNIVEDVSEDIVKKCCNLVPKHLLDLLRSSFIPNNIPSQKPRKGNKSTHMIQSVSKLLRAGIKFKVVKSDSFLEINFINGVIRMPAVTVDDFTSPFFLNCVAYEQCYKHCSKHFTTYATLLDCLINTFKDVEFLCDANIIENYFGTDGEVSRFFNILGKDVHFDINKCYLAGLFDDVNEYYEDAWHVNWAGFKHTYFNTPWSFVSALAAVILLVLTVVQTLFTVYPYYRPR